MRLLFTRCVLATALLAAGPTLAATATGQPTSHAVKRGVRVIQPDVAQTPDAGGGSAAASASGSAPAISPVTHSVIKACDRPNAKADLVFGDAKHFDWELSQALKAGKPVIVDVAQPYDQKAPPPEGLAPWLTAVKDGGGSVRVSPYCMNGRGIARSWLADIVGHLTGSIYKPARSYDVTLYADAGKRKVTQLEFKPKSAAVAER